MCLLSRDSVGVLGFINVFYHGKVVRFDDVVQFFQRKGIVEFAFGLADAVDELSFDLGYTVEELTDIPSSFLLDFAGELFEEIARTVLVRIVAVKALWVDTEQSGVFAVGVGTDPHDRLVVVAAQILDQCLQLRVEFYFFLLRLPFPHLIFNIPLFGTI